MKKCGIFAITNAETGKGLCVGVAEAPKESYDKDVIRVCLLNKRPDPSKPCEGKLLFVFTPEESVQIGLALIKASVLGQQFLEKRETNDLDC
jgi:hypothetical protein